MIHKEIAKYNPEFGDLEVEMKITNNSVMVKLVEVFYEYSYNCVKIVCRKLAF